MSDSGSAGEGVAEARERLVVARRDARPIAAWPAAWKPTDLAAAWALQADVVAAFGEVAAWKVGGVTPAQREAMAIDRPVGAAIPGRFFHDGSMPAAAAASFDRERFIAPLIECEYAFRLGRDLPRRDDRAWTRSEVDAATASMHLSIEIVDPRLPRGSGTLAEVADGFNNGALAIGVAIADWRSIDFASVGIVLMQPGDPPNDLASGSARAVCDGDPFAAVVQLANAQPSVGRGLRAGDCITTGSCTGAPPMTRLGRYVATYAGLGEIAITLR